MGIQNEKASIAVRRQFNSLGTRIVSHHCPDLRPLELDSHLGLLGECAKFRKPRVLDIGCGDGPLRGSLCEADKDVVGIDLSETMLAMAKARCRNAHVTLVQGDGHCLPFTSESFDACNCSFCFANIGDPQLVIEEMTRVLRPGGLIAVTDVVGVGIRERYEVNCLERAREPENTRILELREFAHLFSDLPLRWRSCRLTHQAVDFRRWITASRLRPGSSAFRHAKAVFRQAVLHQHGVGMGTDRRYSYSVARFLLERMH
jgi:SAM-dependent methyltransferase